MSEVPVMQSEHMIILLVGAVLGLLQGIILILMRGGMSKIVSICKDITELRKSISTKAEVAEEKIEHQKIEVKLGQYGDRILTLELAVKVIEHDKEP